MAWSPEQVEVRHWRDRAGCRGVDPDLFFPVGTTPLAAGQVAAAKAVCRACPVREACLRFAIDTGQDAGIWGGRSEDERRALRPSWLARRQRVRVVR